MAPRVSYAFADTRRFVIDMLLEVAQHPIDGVCILYNRRPPLVDYEPPLVDGFKAAYGEDPRQLADDDPRWLAYRGTALTDFHRELREALDDLARAQGRERITVSACVLNRGGEPAQRAGPEEVGRRGVGRYADSLHRRAGFG